MESSSYPPSRKVLGCVFLAISTLTARDDLCAVVVLWLRATLADRKGGCGQRQRASTRPAEENLMIDRPSTV